MTQADSAADTEAIDSAETRDRKSPLRVYVTPSERARIKELASATGLSVSDYLRRSGLHTPIRPLADKQAVDDLLKINADMGRLGGLLKYWLNHKPGSGASVRDVGDTLDDIRKTQQTLLSEISAIRNPRQRRRREKSG